MYYNKFKVMEVLGHDDDLVKIAIVGSREYENKTKIREMIFKLKQTFGDKLEIVSGGALQGADKYAKKYALEMGVNYKEFNPAHTNKNLYSGMPESYYGKPYHVSQLFHRNEIIAKYSDKMIAFIDSTVTSNGSKHAVSMAQKHKKPVVIVNEKA
jgi:predicted Rossmann fold nucleotide-binding protein DprA/Smf involved in DNA uptake